MYLAGTVVASWSLTQEVAGRALLMTNIFVTKFAEFSEWKDWGKTPIDCSTAKQLWSISSLRLKFYLSLYVNFESPMHAVYQVPKIINFQGIPRKIKFEC